MGMDKLSWDARLKSRRASLTTIHKDRGNPGHVHQTAKDPTHNHVRTGKTVVAKWQGP